MSLELRWKAPLIELKIDKIRLDKIESSLKKSDERYMIFFANRVLDLLRRKKLKNNNE